MTAPAGGRALYVLGSPLRWWKSSLPLRVVTSAVLGTLLALLVAGLLLIHRVADGIVVRAQTTALADASEARAQIETDLLSAGSEQIGTSTLTRVAKAAIQRGSESGRYDIMINTGMGALSTPGFDETAVPDALREAVGTDWDKEFSIPTVIHKSDQAPVPGYAVGMMAVVELSGSHYPVFFVFPLAQEQQTLDMVQAGVGIAGLIILVAMGFVAYGVSRQTLKPIRVARRAAERLAAGSLTQPMPVRGTDDLARLAVSMNHMANQLQQRIHELEQLSRLQQRFVSDVSHELRTPLTTVRMAADMLYDARADFPEAENRSAVLLHQELNRFESLLADLLEISRFDAGAVVLALDDADIVELVGGEIASLTKLASGHGSVVRFHHPPVVLARIDARRIARLVRNLLSNAIEHGEGRPIDVTVAEDNELVAIAVRDHGVGFTREQGRQMFNRFWRADPARARRIGGTGLGLAISQEDVRLHQGWIHAWGRPGQGAQFRVTLPKTPEAVVTRSPLPLVPADAAGATVPALTGARSGQPETPASADVVDGVSAAVPSHDGGRMP